MKKRFRFIKDDQGFFLPFVLVLALIILSLLMTTIKLYQSEIIMTRNLMDQLKVDTAIQMTIEELKKDVFHQDMSAGTKVYTFPNKCQVTVSYNLIDDGFVNLDYEVTLEDEYTYIVNQYYKALDMEEDMYTEELDVEVYD